jgi:hypothetical protein
MVFGAPCTLFLLALLFLIAMGRCKVKSAAALLVALCACGFPSLSFADQTLLPTSEMALDDGNASLAERTAQTVLTSLGLAPEERAKAEEVLIRLALKKGAWDEALAKIDACPELPAERRLVFTLAALCGKKEYSRVLQVYDEARISADNLWGVTALRYSLLAAQETGKKLLAAERFSDVQSARGATDVIRAENALAWDAYLPNEASRRALLEAAARRRAEEAEAARRAREEAILRETRRREALLRAAHRRILPTVSPLTGVSAAPCAVKHPPRDLHEASREAIKYWRFFR